jgi:hypothetical protein
MRTAGAYIRTYAAATPSAARAAEAVGLDISAGMLAECREVILRYHKVYYP